MLNVNGLVVSIKPCYKIHCFDLKNLEITEKLVSL